METTTIPAVEVKQEEKKEIRTRGTGSVAKLSIKRKDGSHAESRYWYIWYYNARGKQIRESSKTDSKMKAEALLRTRLEQIGKGVHDPQKASRMKYEDLRADLVDDYEKAGHSSLTHRKNGDVAIPGLNHCDVYFQGMTVAKITTKTLLAFRDQRWQEIMDGKEAGIKQAVDRADEAEKRELETRLREQARLAANATVNRSLSVIRRMFNIQFDRGELSVVPSFPMLSEVGNARQGFVEQTEFDKILAEMPENLRPLTLFLYETGSRFGAAKAVTWKQVAFKEIAISNDPTNPRSEVRAILKVEGQQTKNGEPLTYVLSSELTAMLRRMFRSNGPIFDATNFRVYWNKACDLTGHGTRITHTQYEGLNPHDLRRSAVRNMVRAGTARSVAMKISGHKTESVFERYNITDEEDLKNASLAQEEYKQKQRAKAQAAANA